MALELLSLAKAAFKYPLCNASPPITDTIIITIIKNDRN